MIMKIQYEKNNSKIKNTIEKQQEEKQKNENTLPKTTAEQQKNNDNAIRKKTITNNENTTGKKTIGKTMGKIMKIQQEKIRKRQKNN